MLCVCMQFFLETYYFITGLNPFRKQLHRSSLNPINKLRNIQTSSVETCATSLNVHSFVGKGSKHLLHIIVSVWSLLPFLADATESPIKKSLTSTPSDAVVDASLRAFQGFSIPYGESLTITVRIILLGTFRLRLIYILKNKSKWRARA